MNEPSSIPLRTQRITPGQIRILQTLWSARLWREGKRLGAESSRQARLQRLSAIVGRPVHSAKELNWREANRVIERLLQELGGKRHIYCVSHAAGEETPLAAVGATEGSLEAMLSSAQLWKIQQVAQYLGWSQAGAWGNRLTGFLHAKFHVERPENLTHDQAWRAIEALCAVGARERIQRRKGKGHSVGREELRQEITLLKQELHGWRSTQQCA
ncbi:MAG: DUF1018 domain-containing protein [Acidobacteria bacterium]|nr:DUF1018 domain-containing protein [Acidobacteriota bacterium]